MGETEAPTIHGAQLSVQSGTGGDWQRRPEVAASAAPGRKPEHTPTTTPVVSETSIPSIILAPDHADVKDAQSAVEKETQKSLVQQAKEAFGKAVEKGGPYYYDAADPEMDKVLIDPARQEKLLAQAQAAVGPQKEGETPQAYQARLEEAVKEANADDINIRREASRIYEQVKDASETGMAEVAYVDTDGTPKAKMENVTPEIIKGLKLIDSPLAEQVDQARRVIDPATEEEIPWEKFKEQKLKENSDADPKAIKEEFDKKAIVTQKPAAAENKQQTKPEATASANKQEKNESLTVLETEAVIARQLVQRAIQELVVLEKISPEARNLLIDLNDAYVASSPASESLPTSQIGIKALYDTLQEYNRWYFTNQKNLPYSKKDEGQPYRLQALAQGIVGNTQQMELAGVGQMELASLMASDLFGAKISDSMQQEITKCKGLNWVELKHTYTTLLQEKNQQRLEDLIKGDKEPANVSEKWITFLGRNHQLSENKNWRTFNNPPIDEGRQRIIAAEILQRVNPEAMNLPPPYKDQYIDNMRALLFPRRNIPFFGMILLGSQFMGLCQQLMETGVKDIEGGGQGGQGG